MQTKIKNSIYIVIAVSLSLLIIIAYIPRIIKSASESEVTMLDSWSYEDGTGKDVSINLPVRLPKDDNGDVTLKTVLPKGFTKGQTMCFWTFYQSVDVYLEDALIYRFDNTGGGSFTKAPTPQWNIIDLPESAT